MRGQGCNVVHVAACGTFEPHQFAPSSCYYPPTVPLLHPRSLTRPHTTICQRHHHRKTASVQTKGTCPKGGRPTVATHGKPTVRRGTQRATSVGCHNTRTPRSAMPKPPSDGSGRTPRGSTSTRTTSQRLAARRGRHRSWRSRCSMSPTTRTRSQSRMTRRWRPPTSPSQARWRP